MSVTDPDARHIRKNRTRHQDGFKAHAAFEPETGLFTAVELTGGSGTAVTTPRSPSACRPAKSRR